MKLLTILLLSTITLFGQVSFNEPKSVIKHNELTLYLDSDNNSFISKHELKYNNFLKLDSDRDDKWHSEIKGPYSKEPYLYSGYDMGHLTPSHITSYNDTLNHHSFSFYNQAPQLAGFNRGKWKRLEMSVEDSISKYKSDVIIITGVIYNETKKVYLGKSKIKIPEMYYKILYIKTKKPITYIWVGSNKNGEVMITNIKDLNGVLEQNKSSIKFK
jgi:DNA/RNA endonuclease G (NUC1)